VSQSIHIGIIAGIFDVSANQLVSFGLIVGIFGFLFYVQYAVKSQKGLGIWLKKQVTHRELKLIESMSLGMRTSLHLVEAKGKNVLVLVSPHGVKMISLEERFEEDDSDTLDLQSLQEKR
jgi:hypothetical protein